MAKIKRGDIIRVAGGAVLIGQSGTALSDAPGGWEDCQIQFDGYPKPRIMSASRLQVLKSNVIRSGSYKERADRLMKRPEIQRITDAYIQSKLCAFLLGKEKAKEAKARLFAMDHSEETIQQDEAFVQGQGKIGPVLEKRRKREAFWG